MVFQDLGSLLISAYESSLLYDAVMVRKWINDPINYSHFFKIELFLASSSAVHWKRSQMTWTSKVPGLVVMIQSSPMGWERSWWRACGRSVNSLNLMKI